MEKTNYKIAIITFAGILVSIFMLGTYYGIKYPLKYEEYILAYSEENELDPALVASLINAESGFDRKEISSSGAIGLMQLMPETARWMAENELGIINFENRMLFNAETNIKIGTAYLAYLQSRFVGTNAVLSAYNAGEGNVDVWLASTLYSDNGVRLTQIPFKSTEIYVNKIMDSYKVYKSKLR